MIDFAHGGNVFAVARHLGIAPEELLDFSASINPLGPPAGVKPAVMAAFDRAIHYPDDGALELKEALAAHHCVSPDNITVANGSTELIHLLPRLFPKGRALIVAPPFAEYARALERCGWERDYVHLKEGAGFTLDIAGLRQRLQEGWDLLFLCNPNNPAGSVHPPGDIARVAELCRGTGTFLVLDEAFIDFCPEASAAGLLLSEPEAVVLRSLTKFFAIPGLRLGYSIAHPAVNRRLADLREPWSVNVLAQAAGLAALADTGFRQRTLALIREEAAFLLAGLKAIPGLATFPTAANYLLVRVECPQGLTAAAVRDRLLERRILIRDCANFHGLDARYFRVAVRTREENLRLLDGLRWVLEQ